MSPLTLADQKARFAPMSRPDFFGPNAFQY
jgi:hypothetical protein